LKVAYRLHCGSYAIHIHTSRARRDYRDQSGVLVLGVKLQISPMHKDLGAQANRVAQSPGCLQRLVGGLTIHEQHSSKTKDKIGTLLYRHMRYSSGGNRRDGN
jgi:hypothetical protein